MFLFSKRHAAEVAPEEPPQTQKTTGGGIRGLREAPASSKKPEAVKKRGLFSSIRKARGEREGAVGEGSPWVGSSKKIAVMVYVFWFIQSQC